MSITEEIGQILPNPDDAELDAINQDCREELADWIGDFLDYSDRPEKLHFAIDRCVKKLREIAMRKAKSLADERERLEEDRREGDPNREARVAFERGIGARR